MIYIGLTGHAGVGKDTIADYLAERYGFIKCAFSDGLYQEVQDAFGLPDQALLRGRTTKEMPIAELQLMYCTDPDFVAVVTPLLAALHPGTDRDINNIFMSPRQVTQWWGTEYRRKQNPDYWVEKADEFTYNIWAGAPYPEQRRQLFVNTTCRFPNEQAFIHRYTCGNVWHVHRDGIGPVNGHVSDQALPVLPYEREIWNNGSIEQLCEGVDLMLATAARFVRCEPMLPDVPPEPAAAPLDLLQHEQSR